MQYIDPLSFVRHHHGMGPAVRLQMTVGNGDHIRPDMVSNHPSLMHWTSWLGKLNKPRPTVIFETATQTLFNTAAHSALLMVSPSYACDCWPSFQRSRHIHGWSTSVSCSAIRKVMLYSPDRKEGPGWTLSVSVFLSAKTRVPLGPWYPPLFL